MSGTPVDLSALQDFALVVAHGGIGRASRAIGRPKATLSRRIADLEATLGVRLFDRGARTLRLTDEGRALHARLEAPLGDILDATEATVSGASKPRGRLRVCTPILFGHSYMGRLACEFAATYPDVKLEVISDDRHVDLVEEDIDVVIRVNPKPDELLTGRRFMTDRLVAVSTAPAPPAIGQSNRGGQGAAPIQAVVLTRSPDEMIWELTLGEKRIVVEPRPVLRFSSVLMVRDAVFAGAGAALLPLSMVRADLEVRRLYSWGELVDYEIDLWVLHTSRRLVSRKVVAFVDFMTRKFKPD